MKTRIFFIVIFLGQFFFVYSQNDDFFFVKGRVLDNKTKATLPFVNIAFIDMVDKIQTQRISNGTESNVNGEFILYYPKTKQEKLTLVISYLGYEKRILTFSPSNYDLKDIELSESTSTIQEFIFKDKDLGRKLVEYVLNNIKINYPTKAEIYEGFLKEKTAQDSSMRDIISMSEAITRNLKASYTNPLESDVKLLKGRVFKSREYKEQENPKIQGINTIIFMDVLYNRRGMEDAVRSKKTFFEIEKIISLNGKKTYVVKITHKQYKKSYIRLFIQDKTYAVIRGEFLNCCDILPHEYNILFLGNEEYKKQLLNSGYSHNFLQMDVEYRQYPDSLWRVNYLYYKTYFLFSQYIFYIRKRDLKKSFFAEASYVTTSIYQNLFSNQHLLSEGLKMQEGTVFLEAASQKYDSIFWKNYNVVKSTPEEEFLFSQKEIGKDTYPYRMIQKRELDIYREKVYVHSDKPYYYQGEPMWFKIYVNYKSPEIRDQQSKTLYVEFFSPQKKIIMERVYPIKDGMSFGNWVIPDTLGSGNYYLRVYTNF
ncbi:MAG: carboxypeptidase-like regulatory domain-containing protein, partial [Chitinophagaceae bacterium]|nr:carboxypeptidase-like regulatory domain-containing protein [Chitinophagaceae bacterium]